MYKEFMATLFIIDKNKIIQMSVNIIDTNVAKSCSGILHSDEKVTYCYRKKVSTTET